MTQVIPSIYLILLLLLLVSQRLLPLLLHPQLPGLLQHPLMVRHRLHLVERKHHSVLRQSSEGQQK